MDAKKLKALVKKPAPPSTFGTNPSDPWSAKAGLAEEVITEDMLDDYLKAKGIDPRYVSMQTKVSHAKSHQFKKWARDRKTLGEDRKMEPSHTEKKLQDLKKSVSSHKEVETPRGPGYHKEENRPLDENGFSEAKEADYGGDYQAMVLRMKEKAKKKPVNSDALAARMQASYKKDKEKKMKEDVGDAKAATHADGLTASVDQMQAEKKMSRVKRIKKMMGKVVKEDMYDHEKEDKSVATYGKKPKLDLANKDDSKGENKPQAAAVLSGGKTMTGSERDTVELDPMMRNRPNQPDVTKKDDKKDGKKDENKKDK